MFQTYSFDPITFGLIVFTCIFSISAFNREDRINKFSFYPYQIRNHKEHYRFLSHAFIHADFAHLFFNMFGLYIFGGELEQFFVALYGKGIGVLVFLGFYTTAIYASSVPQYFQQRNNRYFSSVGASGAVNAIVFANIMINPTMKLSLIIIPVPMPAWVFGLLYLAVSFFLARRKANNPADNIDHWAHLWGAAYGILFICLLQPALVPEFFRQVGLTG